MQLLFGFVAGSQIGTGVGVSVGIGVGEDGVGELGEGEGEGGGGGGPPLTHISVVNDGQSTPKSVHHLWRILGVPQVPSGSVHAG